jgi:phosphate transport system protein
MPRDTFSGELDNLKNQLLQLGVDAGRTIGNGVEALKTRDRALAEAIIAHDDEINRVRYDIEEKCYELIATQQPLASDLREIISILLVAIELERIADHSKNLAEIVIHMGDAPLLKPLIDIPRMADITQSMLNQALEAFARRDAEMGRAVCNRDDEIDQLYQQVFRELLTFVMEDPRTVSRALNLLFAAHNIERIGDRITNIGERVIYAATGRLEELNVQRPETE